VYQLTGTAGTLACTLTLTVRKFISLVISILYFKNPFTMYHWLGGILVFVGTAVYSTAPKAVQKNKEE
jgi:UDP-xylose/UDP-N-acetylglucosamine transporter B4